MAEYRHSAHASFDLKYHMIWITKYRYKILRGDVAERARDVIRQICQTRDVVIIRGAVSPEPHPYAVLGPAASGAGKAYAIHQGTVVAKTTRRIPRVAKAVLGAASRARGYFCATVGAVDEQTIKPILKTRSGTKTIRDSRSPRPPSLEAAL